MVIISLLSSSSVAETYEEFKKRLLQKNQSQKQQFQTFKSSQQQAFYNHLKQQWQDFRVAQGKPEDAAAKPQVIPKITLKTKSKPTKIVTLKPQFKKNLKPEKEKVNIEENRVAKKHQYPVDIDFFSSSIDWQSDAKWQQWRATRINQITNSVIADYWQQFSKLDATLILNQLQKTSSKLKLNDWGKIKLLEKFGESLNLSKNQQLLTIWALLNEADYDVRVGYKDNTVFLLYHSKQRLYSTPYFRFDNKRYYLYSASNKKVFKLKSYKGNLRASPNPLNLQLSSAPTLNESHQKRYIKNRQLMVNWRDNQYNFTVTIYQPEISYLDTLPQQQLKNYFAFLPNKNITDNLIPSLRQVIKPMAADEKINFLLRFVQTAFPYATDQEQFNYENYLLPDETFYYPASDCEDRSILFAWLINKLTPYQIIAVDYPGHVATAIALPNSVKGSVKSKKYNFKGKQFTVADPTYINASLGMEMPQFKNAKPKFIAIN